MHILPSVSFAAVVLALHPSLAAQDSPAVVEAPQLVVKTTQERLAAGLLRFSQQDLPGLTAGEHYVLTMSAQGDLVATTGKGAVPFVVIEARPGVLMATFAEQVDQARRMAKMTASMAATSSPMKPAQMAQMMDAIFDFPLQIETVTITVDGDDQKGWEAHTEILPKAGSALEGGVQGLRSSGKGAPRLGEGVMGMACDVDRSVLKNLGGMFSWVANMVAEEDRPAVRKLMDAQFAASDGTLAFVMRDGSIRMMLGCADPEGMRKIMASEDWTKMQHAFMAGMQGADVKVEREKVGDLDVVHTFGELGELGDVGTGNAFAKDGKIDGWATVVGDMLVSVVNGGRKPFDDLVRSAAAGTVERVPLPSGSVLTMRMQMADMMAMSGQDVPPGMPDTITLSLAKKAKSTLVLDVHVGM